MQRGVYYVVFFFLFAHLYVRLFFDHVYGIYDKDLYLNTFVFRWEIQHQFVYEACVELFV